MECHEANERLVEVYFGEAPDTLKGQVLEHVGSCGRCAAEWRGFERISQAVKGLAEPSPSQLSLNKIMAYANEHAEQLPGRGFWSFLWQPKLGLALALLIAFFGTRTLWQGMFASGQDTTVAVNDPTVSDVPVSGMNIHSRFFKTPLDDMSPDAGLSTATSGTISYVSTDNRQTFGSQHFAFDDVLDQKMLLNHLNDSDLDALFFRARKMEKLGDYREALNDYEFIAKFHPDFNNIQAVNFSMARCLQGLGYTEMAVSLLEQLKASDPDNQDIKFWLDQLKSETL